jgi:hypothetical protein
MEGTGEAGGFVKHPIKSGKYDKFELSIFTDNLMAEGAF